MLLTIFVISVIAFLIVAFNSFFSYYRFSKKKEKNKKIDNELHMGAVEIVEKLNKYYEMDCKIVVGKKNGYVMGKNVIIMEKFDYISTSLAALIVVCHEYGHFIKEKRNGINKALIFFRVLDALLWIYLMVSVVLNSYSMQLVMILLIISIIKGVVNYREESQTNKIVLNEIFSYLALTEINDTLVKEQLNYAISTYYASTIIEIFLILILFI